MDKSIDLIDSLITNNDAYYGGGLFATKAPEITCTGSSSADAGFFSNTADYGSAVRLGSFTGSLTSDVCDLGEGGDDNADTDTDISYSSGDSYSFGDDESFTCDSSGCE